MRTGTVGVFSLCLVIIIAAISAGCSDGEPKQGSTEDYITRAHTAEGNFDYGSAIDYYSKALTVDSKNTVALKGKIHALLAKNRAEEALQLCSQAIAINPSDGLIYVYQGVALNELGRYSDALKAFDRAYTLDPSLKYIPQLKLLAESNQILKTDPNNASALLIKGSAYCSLVVNGSYFNGNARQYLLGPSRATLIKATEFNPDNALAWRELGLVNSRIQPNIFSNNTAAIDAFQKSIALNPNDDGTWADLGYALYGSHKLEDALQAYDRALSLNPQNEQAKRYRDLVLSLMPGQSKK